MDIDNIAIAGFRPKQVEKTVQALKAAGITCRDNLQKYDKASKLKDLQGIGPARGKIVLALKKLSEGEWTRVTGLPAHSPEMQDQSEYLGQGKGEI